MQDNLTAAVVPVFNPERGLVGLCRELCESFGVVVVVDDGSVENQSEFSKLPEKCEIVRHAVNKGKGRAIKSAIEYIRVHHPDVTVMVCCDGDGQHSPSDALKVASEAREKDCVTLGVRNIDKKGIPFRSRFGNVLTSLLVRIFLRLSIGDTQTGMRAIPSRLFDSFLSLPGERYEYEMRQFSMLKSLGESVGQVPIKTIYIESNRTSHFRPVVDSVRVYYGLFGGTFLKFCGSSVLGFLVDNIVFAGMLFALATQDLPRRYDIFIAVVVARAVSATVNYVVNKLFVFGSKGSVVASYMRYWALVFGVLIISYSLTALLSAVLDAQDGLVITTIKVVEETVLFLVSYRLQKKWVFKGEKKSKK